jgi:hypothetical protein
MLIRRAPELAAFPWFLLALLLVLIHFDTIIALFTVVWDTVFRQLVKLFWEGIGISKCSRHCSFLLTTILKAKGSESPTL